MTPSTRSPRACRRHSTSICSCPGSRARSTTRPSSLRTSVRAAFVVKSQKGCSGEKGGAEPSFSTCFIPIDIEISFATQARLSRRTLRRFAATSLSACCASSATSTSFTLTRSPVRIFSFLLLPLLTTLLFVCLLCIEIGAEAHINACFKHFYLFCNEFKLVDEAEYQPVVRFLSTLSFVTVLLCVFWLVSFACACPPISSALRRDLLVATPHPQHCRLSGGPRG